MCFAGFGFCRRWRWCVFWALLSRFHPQGQFWHDALAGTRLVHHEPPPRQQIKK